MYRKTGWGLAGVALLVAMCIWAISAVPPQLGIDLRGGTELTYELDLSRIERDRAKVAGEVKDIIAKRLNAYGLKEISVSVQGQDRLVIQLPGTDQQAVDDLKKQIETAGNLTFRLVAPQDMQNEQRYEEYRDLEREYLASDRAWVQRKLDNPDLQEERPKPPEYIVRSEVLRETVNGRDVYVPKPGGAKLLENFHTEYNPSSAEWEPQGIISGRFLSRVYDTIDPKSYKPAVGFEFKGEGATSFGELTGPNVNRLLSIVLDDDIMQVATIQSRITERGQLTGEFTPEEVRSIITILRGGSLPTKPKLISESTVGALLGQDTITSGIRAVIVGAAGVMLVMAIYYMVAGMVADLALLLNLVIIFGFVVLFRQTLTLPGLAGVILTLGMAVDANILIFERYREERRKGKPLVASLSAGYSRAFSVILDSNLTTIMTGYVLFYLGTPEIKGFAVTLIAGIFASFFTSVFVTRLVLSALINWGLVKDLKILEAFPTPRIPFVRYRKRFMAGSAIVILATWSLVFYRGSENYGIDFTGGARVTMNLMRSIPLEEMRSKMEGLKRESPDLFRDYVLQTVRPDAPGRSETYTLLTRAGARGAGALLPEAEAQESPAGEDASAASPGTSPAEAEAPPAEGGAAPQPVPEAEAPAAPGSAPAPTAPGAAPVRPAASQTLTEEEELAEDAQRVQKALESMLAREGLLLPDSFPRADWIDDPAPAPAGSQHLEIEVNLRTVAAEYDSDRIREELNAALEENPLLARSGREESAYKGIEVTSVELVSLKTDDLPVTRYLMKTSSYVPPGVSDRADDTRPTKQQVASAIRAFFRDKADPKQLLIAEPFPQVMTVGPRVASSLQADALVAIFIAIVGIVFYLSLRFEFIYGVAGIVALLHDAMVVIGVMALADEFLPDFSIKFNLTELAAVLSIIGYSINDTIVLFDRIRENNEILVKRKYSLEDIMDLSMNQTLLRSLWTTLTTLLVIVLLLGFGGESVRGFAFLFAVGLVAGSYSSIFIAAPVALRLHERSLARRQAAATA